MRVVEWHLKAITDVWTGTEKGNNNRLVTTGLLGSLRWWYEVLVRGLGGKACDPTEERIRCPNIYTRTRRHCVVCELFGCTGWTRKFRLIILDEQDNVKTGQIESGQTFKLRFIPLRPIRNEEWCLLDMTIRLVAEYGAIGGKTVFKPSDEQDRQDAIHHRDFGLISYSAGPDNWKCDIALDVLRDYVLLSKWRNVHHSYTDQNGNIHDFSWASLSNFWCVKGRYLARQNDDKSSFNIILGRDQRKKCKSCDEVHLPGQECPKTGRHVRRYSDDCPSSYEYRWIAGRQRESKKIFSFKYPDEGGRTYGFVNPDLVDFDYIKTRLKLVWTDLSDDEFYTGPYIINILYQLSGGRSL